MNTNTTSAESVTGLTFEEAMESLTGFDEIAIEKHFDGLDVYSEGKAKPIRAMRALAFVWHRRQGANDREALQAAQNLSFKEITGYFAEPEDEVDPEDTESGKGSEPSA